MLSGFLLALFRSVRSAAGVLRSRYPLSLQRVTPDHGSAFVAQSLPCFRPHLSMVLKAAPPKSVGDYGINLSPRSDSRPRPIFNFIRKTRSATPQKYYPSALATGAPT
jgi:hypothetical protein